MLSSCFHLGIVYDCSVRQVFYPTQNNWHQITYDAKTTRVMTPHQYKILFSTIILLFILLNWSDSGLCTLARTFYVKFTIKAVKGRWNRWGTNIIPIFPLCVLLLKALRVGDFGSFFFFFYVFVLVLFTWKRWMRNKYVLCSVLGNHRTHMKAIQRSNKFIPFITLITIII